MLNNREKVGHEVCSQMATSGPMQFAKVKRLTLPFGPKVVTTPQGHKDSAHEDTEDEEDRSLLKDTQHEHNLRELPLGQGALGCALWDGGLVLSRWIYYHGGIFQGAKVLELGSGVGLAGIMAAHWAKHVTMSDYILEVVENSLYNAKLNSEDVHEETSEEEEGEEEQDGKGSKKENDDGGDQKQQKRKRKKKFQSVSGGLYHRCLQNRIDAVLLDWDAEEFCKKDKEKEEEKKSTDGKKSAEKEEEGWCVCTRITNAAMHVQPWYRCQTCYPNDDSMGCCEPCAKRCHAHHPGLSPTPASVTEKFKCDAHSPCKAFPRCQLKPHSFDIIIGAELTYNLLSCHSLPHVIDRFLTLESDGVFYEVLSDDRDGVLDFIKAIEALGFVTSKYPASQSVPSIVGNFQTRKWSKQDLETYSLYTWRRKATTTSKENTVGIPLSGSAEGQQISLPPPRGDQHYDEETAKNEKLSGKGAFRFPDMK